MKYFKRLEIYKANNVTFNPKSFEAYSYRWWRFVAKVDGKIVFNNHRYSPSTGKHQYKVRALLRELGIKIDIEMPLPKGIQNYSTLDEMILAAEEHLCDAFLSDVFKKQERYQRAKAKKIEKKQLLASVTHLVLVKNIPTHSSGSQASALMNRGDFIKGDAS